MQTAADLAQLPPPPVVEVLDFEAVLDARKADLQARIDALGDPALSASVAAALASEAEPLVIDLEQAAYRELVLRARVNDAARAGMLATATGADLENLAANLGVTRLAGEEDERLRLRAFLGPETFSVAGPELAYVGLALGASLLVADVRVTSPAPGQVRVAVLSTAADGVADAALLATVAAVVGAKKKRPLTDQVSVVSAAVANWTVTATLKLAADVLQGPVLDAAGAALAAYAAGRRRIGRGVARAGVEAALMRPGVENLTLAAPLADIAAAADMAPVLGVVTLNAVVGGSGV